MSKNAPYKQKVVKEYTELLDKYNIVGAVNMENLPTPQLQKMRQTLRESVLIKMTKRRLMAIAINSSTKKGIKEILPHLKGMPALLFTNENPFKLYSILKKNKSKAPAKAGQIAPADIIVSAGATPFAPGPVIGELGALGIKSGVENGKVAIKEDKIVVKEGQVISDKVASLITRLSILPMEIGLDLTAVIEDGVVYTKSVLDIDEDAFLRSLSEAGNSAYNLAFEIAYTTIDTIEPLLAKCYRETLSLAREASIMVPELMEEMIINAQAGASSLALEAGFTTSMDKLVPEDIKHADKIIAEIKDHSTKGKTPSAVEIVNEVKKEIDEKKQEDEKKKVPSAHELAEKKDPNRR